MKTTAKSNPDTTVALPIAGEDIQCGDYVTVLNEIIELPSFLWNCSGAALQADELVRTQIMPDDAGQPFKVIAVCLPFVYTRPPQGQLTTFDTRRHQLVRLDSENGRTVWKQMQKSLKSKLK